MTNLDRNLARERLSKARGESATANDSDTLTALIRSLTLVETGTDRFQTALPVEKWQRLFGGEILAQALTAASHTVAADRLPHLIHGHFLRPGRPEVPIAFRVERDRDGASFSSRRVVAYQEEVLVFTLGASFHPAEAGYAHQEDMPDVTPPEGLRSEEDIRREQAGAMIGAVRDFALRSMPIELRPVTPRDFVSPVPQPAVQHFWFKPKSSVPDNGLLLRAVLAYVSDMMLLSTALLPHGTHWSTTRIHNASLNHSLWLHAQPDFSDWMLYSLDSPWAGGGRALCRGRIFDRAGKLVASVAQEGLLRLR